MDPNEPYRPPESDITDDASGQGARGSRITAAMVDELRGTRPWVLLVSILMFIFIGFMLIAAVVMFTLGLGGADADITGPVTGVAAGSIYVLLAVLYFVPSLSLFRYGRAIKRIAGSTSIEAIEESLGHQRRFWRFVGVVALAFLVMYALVILAMVVFGILGTAGAG